MSTENYLAPCKYYDLDELIIICTGAAKLLTMLLIFYKEYFISLATLFCISYTRVCLTVYINVCINVSPHTHCNRHP